MKGFEVILKKDLLQGLRQWGADHEDEDKLIECLNFAPSQEGLEIHEALIPPDHEDAFLLVSGGIYLLLDTGDKILLV